MIVGIVVGLYYNIVGTSWDFYLKLESLVPALRRRRERISAERWANFQAYFADIAAFNDAVCKPIAEAFVAGIKATPAFVESGWGLWVWSTNIGVSISIRPSDDVPWDDTYPIFDFKPELEDDAYLKGRRPYRPGIDRMVVQFIIHEPNGQPGWYTSEELLRLRLLQVVSGGK